MASVESENQPRLPRVLLIRVLLRTFLLQASWNFERLQSLGFLYVLAPALRHLYREEERREAFGRHLDFFNTHPYMASPVAGTVLAMEGGLPKEDLRYPDVQDFKKMVMAPYAAMGDALFWGGIRPLAAGVALFFAVQESLWAPAVFLLLFNAPHLWIRIAGFGRGYSMGIRIVEFIQRRRIPDMAIRLKEGTVVLLGGLCAYLTFLALARNGMTPGWGIFVIPAVILMGWMARKGISSLLIAMGGAAVVLAVFRFV